MANNSMVLGLRPGTLRVNLTTGADFICTLRLRNQDWPVGTTLSLVFASGESWSATISGADATFNVDKATADTIDDRTAVSLKYVNGTTDQTFEIGTVVRHG